MRSDAAQWLLGSACVLLFPLAFPLLLGHAVRAIRCAAADPAAGPPGWRWEGALLREGALAGLAFAILTLPFAAAWWPLSSLLLAVWHPTGQPFLDRAYALLPAAAVVGLPWGLLCILLLPPALARFAASGRPADLFDAGGAVRLVRAGFGRWNLSGALIVTGWLIGLAAAGLCCVGVLPGVYYAILVSAHATASLLPEGEPAR